MNFFQRRKILRRANFLDLRPVRKRDHHIDESGKLRIVVPKFKTEKLANFMLPPAKSRNFRIGLDDIGKEVWLHIDGKRTVREICDAMSDLFGENVHPAEERITKFLGRLYEQRYITFRELMDQ